MPTDTDLLRRAVEAVPRQPWKNGRGVTRELAQGRGWRISLADVAADGDFSLFPGTTRFSVVVSAQGVDLFCGSERLALDPGAVVRYDGALPWTAHLRGGPAQILNVMVQRGMAEADVEVLSAPSRTMVAAGQPLLLLPLDTGVLCRPADAPAFDLLAEEFLLWTPASPQEITLAGSAQARALRACIRTPPAGG